jgi:hypothetical protein
MRALLLTGHDLRFGEIEQLGWLVKCCRTVRKWGCGQ